MSHYNEFDDPPRGGIAGKLSAILDRQGGGRGSRTPTLWIVIVALGTLGAIIWSTYPKGENITQRNVPIVRADVQAFKTTPDDPGGMDIPHRDSTVFSSLRSGRQDQDSGIENLLAEEETEDPVPRSQLFAGLNTEGQAQDDAAQETASAAMAEPAAGEAEEIAEPDVEEAVAESSPAPTPTPEAKPEEEAKVVAKTAPSAGAAMPLGSFYVQLASVKSEPAANTEWKKFQAKYPQLSGYYHRVQRADLGDKGTFYRIQAGPVSKDKAVSTCEAIKQVTPGGCLVTE